MRTKKATAYLILVYIFGSAKRIVDLKKCWTTEIYTDSRHRWNSESHLFSKGDGGLQRSHAPFGATNAQQIKRLMQHSDASNAGKTRFIQGLIWGTSCINFIFRIIQVKFFTPCRGMWLVGNDNSWKTSQVPPPSLKQENPERSEMNLWLKMTQRTAQISRVQDSQRYLWQNGANTFVTRLESQVHETKSIELKTFVVPNLEVKWHQLLIFFLWFQSQSCCTENFWETNFLFLFAHRR